MCFVSASSVDNQKRVTLVQIPIESGHSVLEVYDIPQFIDEYYCSKSEICSTVLGKGKEKRKSHEERGLISDIPPQSSRRRQGHR